MIRRYGKKLNQNGLGRNISTIKKLIEFNRIQSEKYYIAPTERKPSCKLCESSNTHIFYKAWDLYEYWECQECHTVFLNNMPDTKKMYFEAEETANTKNLIDAKVWEKRIEMITGPKVEFVLEVSEKLSLSISRWLDIGCGGGEVLWYLKQTRDIEAQGIDADKKECAFACERGLNVHRAFLDENHPQQNVEEIIYNADVVSIFNMVEHLESPKRFIQYVKSKMKSGSLLVIEVPRHPSVASFANLTNNHAVYRHILSPVHFYIFSDKSVPILLGNDIDVEAAWYFGQGYSDLLNSLMIQANLYESPLYSNLMQLADIIQPQLDKAGFSDDMIIISRRR